MQNIDRRKNMQNLDRLGERTMGIILGGGKGERLYPLTEMRAKPAVPIAGKYRLIDVPISNCIHSNINKIFVLTQFNSASLNRHINLTYKFDTFGNGFVEILAAEQSRANLDWFQGTADAIRQTMHHYSQYRPKYYLILSGDQLYSLDFKRAMKEHVANGADLTICTNVVNRKDATGFGLMNINDKGEILEFVEKPKEPEILDRFRITPETREKQKLKCGEDSYLASMGIYIFNADFMERILVENQGTDFGKHIIPAQIGNAKVFSFVYEGYWEDVGTIQSYFNANLEMTGKFPRFDLYSPETFLFTKARYLPNSKLYDTRMKDTIVAEGAIIDTADLYNSVVGVRSIIQSGVKMVNTIMLGADYYQTLDEIEALEKKKHPKMGVGINTYIENTIIDKNVSIGRNCKVYNKDNLLEYDCSSYSIREGIIIIKKNAVIPDNTII